MIHALVALLLTIVVEAAVIALMAGGPRRWSVVQTSVGLNLLTNPLANWLYTGTLPSFLAIEAAVVAIEALLYAVIERPSARRALQWSLCANGVTMALSFVV